MVAVRLTDRCLDHQLAFVESVHYSVLMNQANNFPFAGATVYFLAWPKLIDYNHPSHVEFSGFAFNVFLRLVRRGCARFCFAGTCFEYGICEGPQDPWAKLAPNSLYSIAKVELSAKLLDYSKKNDAISILWCRFFYLFDEIEGNSGLTNFILKEAKSGSSKICLGDGERKLDFISYDRAVRQAHEKLGRMAKNYEVVNICSGKPVSVREFCEKFIHDNPMLDNSILACLDFDGKRQSIDDRHHFWGAHP